MTQYEAYQLLAIYLGFSLVGSWCILSLASDFSVSLNALENKPSNWLLIIFLLPGLLVTTAFAVFIWSLTLPFTSLDWLWKNRKKS